MNMNKTNLKFLATFILITFNILIISINCSKKEATLRKAKNLIDSKKPEEAMEILREYVIDNSYDADAFLLMGKASSEMANFNDADHYYLTVLVLDSLKKNEVADGYFLLAKKCFEKGRKDLTQKALARVFHINNDYPFGDFTLTLADYFFDEKMFQQSIILYKKVIETDTVKDNKAEALLNTGKAQEKIGLLKEAVESYTKYLEEYYRYIGRDEALWHRGECALNIAEKAFEEKNYSDAINYLQIVISNGVPVNKLDEAYFIRGEIFLALGDNKSAEQDFLKVLDLTPYRTGNLVRKATERIRNIRSSK